MVLVGCISRSHRLKIDFRDENFKNLLFVQIMALGHKMTTLGVTREVASFQQIPIYSFKHDSGEPFRATWPSCLKKVILKKVSRSMAKKA